MQIPDLAFSTLFLIFLILFLLIGNSPALHRWLDRVTGMGRQEGEETPRKKDAGESPGVVSRQAREYEALVFQQLALAGEKGLSPTKLAGQLHFDLPMVAKALASLERKGMIRQGGLLGRRFRLSPKGREHAVQEGIIPRLRSGGGSG